MCFSLEASLTSGLALSAVGAVTLKKVSVPSQTAFAAIPLLFGLQQISEGVVWHALSGTGNVVQEQAGTFAFLFFARVFWPVFIPLAVYSMEQNQRIKKNLSKFVGMGSLVALYYLYCLIFLSVTPRIEGHHIQYISDYPDVLAAPVFFLYFAASIPPLFFSSHKRIKIFGSLLFLACVITGIFFLHFLTSVWCFFAAAISVVVWWIVDKKEG